MATNWAEWTRNASHEAQRNLDEQRGILADPKATPAQKDEAASKAADYKSIVDGYIW